MKIGLNAHLLSSQPGYRSAGIHNVIHHLLTYMPQLAPDDWQFEAMVSRDNPASYAGMTMRRATWNTEPPSKRILWEQIAQPLQLGGYDLYHAMAFVGPLLINKPMVVTVYDLTFIHYPERLTTMRRLYLRLLTAISCRRAERITAISHSTGRDLTDLLGIPPDKIDVTPLGYDRDLYRPVPQHQIEAFRREKGLPERFWFFIGTLEPRKNLVTLLDAYAALPANERLPLVLAGGKGWLYEDIFAAIERHQLQDSVHLPGFLPTDEVPLWYNSAEVMVYPSVFEGFGLPVLEAMACGTPVITSNVSSLPEVAGESGLCLPPHDIEAWTQALRMAALDGDWCEQARERGLMEAQQFSWEQTARLTLDSYRKALKI